MVIILHKNQPSTCADQNKNVKEKLIKKKKIQEASNNEECSASPCHLRLVIIYRSSGNLSLSSIARQTRGSANMIVQDGTTYVFYTHRQDCYRHRIEYGPSRLDIDDVHNSLNCLVLGDHNDLQICIDLCEVSLVSTAPQVCQKD